MVLFFCSRAVCRVLVRCSCYWPWCRTERSVRLRIDALLTFLVASSHWRCGVQPRLWRSQHVALQNTSFALCPASREDAKIDRLSSPRLLNPGFFHALLMKLRAASFSRSPCSQTRGGLLRRSWCGWAAQPNHPRRLLANLVVIHPLCALQTGPPRNAALLTRRSQLPRWLAPAAALKTCVCRGSVPGTHYTHTHTHPHSSTSSSAEQVSKPFTLDITLTQARLVSIALQQLRLIL